MKTNYKFILIIAILFLSGMTINTSYASKPPAQKALSTTTMQILAPATPAEADFNDAYIILTFEIAALAPTTPVEANFNDDIIDLTDFIIAFAPTTPVEADFSDSL